MSKKKIAQQTRRTKQAPKQTKNVAYRRVQHAAHYLGGHGGHDLEQWDSAQAWNDPRPAGVPVNAEKHSGYLRDGVQHVVFVRRAPMTGTCSECAAAERAVA